MSKALVTGANGFIGSHLTKALQDQGEDVACLVRKTSSVERLASLGARMVYGDVTDRESLDVPISGTDVVYHVAGRTIALKKQDFFDVNETGTRNIVEVAAKQETPPTVIVVSSQAAAGPMLDGRPRTEADPAEPVSNYGRSKLAGEMAARQFADRVPMTIVRPPMVLGEGDPLGLQLFQPIARFGLHWVPALGTDTFSVIHSADLASLIILAAKNGRRLQPGESEGPSAAQGVYYAACEVAPTYADLGRMVAKALGRRVRVVPTPPRAVWVVAGVSHTLASLIRKPCYLNLDKAHEIRAGSWVCSVQAATDELGFSTTASLQDRLAQTAQWYRREGWLR